MDTNGIMIWGSSHSSNRRRVWDSEEDQAITICTLNDQLPPHLHLGKKTPDKFFDHYGRQWPVSQLPEEILRGWTVEGAVGGGIGVRPNSRNSRHAHVLTWTDGKLVITEGTKAPSSDEHTVLQLLSAAFMRRCELAFRYELEAWVDTHIKRARATPLAHDSYARAWYVLPQYADDFMGMSKALDGAGILQYVKLTDVQNSGVRHEVKTYLQSQLEEVTPLLLKGGTEGDRQRALQLLTDTIPAYDKVFDIKSSPELARGMTVLQAVMGV